MKFNPNDFWGINQKKRARVINVTEINKYIKKGMIGHIIGEDTEDYCIEFDEFIDGHSCSSSGSSGRYGYCWYFSKNDVEVLD